MQNSVTAPADQKQLRTPRIAVIGDIMVDVDLHCSCTRLCQEGPWPVLSIERTERRMGGAGNVFGMVQTLGAQTLLLGLMGSEFDSLPYRIGPDIGCAWVPGRTTTKTRVWIDGRLTGPRIDHDLTSTSNEAQVYRFERAIKSFDPDAVIVSDHGKGVVTESLMRMLGQLQVPLLIDPISTTPDPLIYRWSDAIVGHEHELPRWGGSLCTVTKYGADGLRWWCGGPSRDGSLPSACRNLVDPLGAGDQFIAALAYQRCLGVDWPEAIEWANIAAGLQCERPGCVPVSVEDVAYRRQDIAECVVR